MNRQLKIAISGLVIASQSIVGLPVRACLPHDPRQVLDAIDARQGFAGFTEISGGYARSKRVTRFRYWRGPCMLYWLGSGREAGVIHWHMFDAATLEQGRLILTSADETEIVMMAFSNAVTEEERAEAVAAADLVIQSCKHAKG